jgi:hypothetical protein
VAAVLALVLSLLGTPAAGAVPPGNALPPGAVLATGQSLRSPNGAYVLAMRRDGRLVLTRGSRVVWTTPGTGAHARLVLRPHGDLVVVSGRRLLWSSGTAGSGARRLVLSDSGVAALRSWGGTVWSTRVGNACRTGVRGRRVTIDLSRQFARLCAGSRQLLTTPITSGAYALGDATPTGVWTVQAKQRDRYLYPASGGAYYVHYWIPYDGAYGMHDSPWQHFPYGSPLYRTRGSHGCVHFPAAAMRWLYGWVRVGTAVRIAP